MSAEATDTAAFLRPRLAAALGVKPELVTDDLELATLGLSSLEIMELIYDAEDHLGIVFPEESLADVTTVGQLLAAVDAESEREKSAVDG
jgi:acyl carrier protein